MCEKREDPKTFSELVELLNQMNWNEYVENDDTGKLRVVVIGNLTGCCYELYEEEELVGCTDDVVAAAEFIAEGWEVYEQMGNHKG